MSSTPKPVVLCLLDRSGYDPTSKPTAIAAGNTPNYDRLMQTVPFATLNTSGQHVGLPDGQMGNSEVGHMNIGAGRVVMQDLPRIDGLVEAPVIRDVPLPDGRVQRLMHVRNALAAREIGRT